ncbi:unnamed product, partial [Ostreococcus tauri]
AYGTTRRDAWGTFARSSGRAATKTASSLSKWNSEHRVSEKAVAAVTTTAKAATDFNDKHRVVETIGRTVSTAAETASELNRRYEVTDTIGRGVSTSLDAVTRAMSRDGSRAAASAASVAPSS